MFSTKLPRAFSPALVIAMLALVLSLGGSAYAAKKYVLTSTSQVKPSVLKTLKGNAGRAGATGRTGTAGPAGPAGGKGDTGAKGEAGAPGAAGAKGDTGTKGDTGAKGDAGARGPSDGYYALGDDTANLFDGGAVQLINNASVSLPAGGKDVITAKLTVSNNGAMGATVDCVLTHNGSTGPFDDAVHTVLAAKNSAGSVQTITLTGFASTFGGVACQDNGGNVAASNVKIWGLAVATLTNQTGTI